MMAFITFESHTAGDWDTIHKAVVKNASVYVKSNDQKATMDQ